MAPMCVASGRPLRGENVVTCRGDIGLRRERVRKSGHCGVLSVNGPDDLAEQNVLNLADAAVSPPAGQGATRFDALFQRFYSELFGLVYRVLGDRMETEDTLQEAFLKLSDDAGLQARPDAEVGAWLRRVAINLAFNRLRSAKRARASGVLGRFPSGRCPRKPAPSGRLPPSGRSGRAGPLPPGSTPP